METNKEMKIKVNCTHFYFRGDPVSGFICNICGAKTADIMHWPTKEIEIEPPTSQDEKPDFTEEELSRLWDWWELATDCGKEYDGDYSKTEKSIHRKLKKYLGY